MKLMYKNKKNGAITLAYVTDNDAEVLEAVGYYHCDEEDFVANSEYLEVWKPKDN